MKVLAYAQHSKRTKPPPMKIQRKRGKLCLQPHEGERLYLIYDM